MKTNLFFLCMLSSLWAFAQRDSARLLDKNWSFALDPVGIGEKQKWFGSDFLANGWDKVEVPHSFSVDKRYHGYTGDAWYIKSFDTISLTQGHRAFVQFDAVYYKCQVWLNGKLLGTHEGGYTPFEFDITEQLTKQNVLTLKVNNAWDTTTIPGAKTNTIFEKTSSSQLFPWINYGGITRPVRIIVRPDAYVRNVKVVATPDLSKKTASLKVTAFVVNRSLKAIQADQARLVVSLANDIIPNKPTRSKNSIMSGKEGIISFDAVIKNISLWNIDDPVLYQASVVVEQDTFTTNFGIRSVEIKGTSLLLNGEPVKMGGCNRPLDHPDYGSLDPQQVLEEDFKLMKRGSMELSRLSHYPVSSELLDQADRRGILIIAEAGNWQMTPAQMSDSSMRRKFENQFREMIERDWNHPSVIAWSVGNEYQSQ
ncbi:MAG TPA: glycoside hydrolase family 2 TIM barrel-domain containing protein, partial [Chryseosolibacter sp.]